MKALSIKSLALLALLQFPLISQAAVITFLDVYTSQMTTTGAGNFGTATVALEGGTRSFDSSFGTLTDMSINISGFLSFSGQHAANYMPGPFGLPLASPFQALTTYELNITGLGGELFSFSSPFVLENAFNVAGGTNPTAFAFTTNFSLNYDYIPLADLFITPSVSCGGVSCNPPTGISGTLDDFITENLLIDQMLFNYSLQVEEIGRTTLLPSIWNVTSVISITTNYTFSQPDPDPDPDPTPVPAPGSLALLLAGIAAILKHTRYRRHPRV